MGHRPVELAGWEGPWGPDDPDANFKADVALYARAEPMATIEALSRSTGIPEGAIVHYVLARWASEGNAGLLELGPRMVHRLWEPVAEAEREGSDAARLAAYDQLRQMLSWLRIPLLAEAPAPPAPPAPPGEADEAGGADLRGAAGTEGVGGT